MNKYLLVISFLSLNFCFSEAITGYQVAEMINNQPQPSNSKSNIIMNLINTKKNRERKSEMFSISKDDGNKMLLFFKSPKRDKGIGFLKIESEETDKMSLFIPKLKKIRRISSNKQSDSFMGSDLSYEDMLSRDLDKFNYKIISEDDNFYILKTTPKNNDSEYSWHKSWVSKQDLFIVKEESYDKKNKLLKEKFFEHTIISNYKLISKINVHNVQKNHRTVLEINNLEINGDISDDIFQEKNLKRFEKFTN